MSPCTHYYKIIKKICLTKAGIMYEQNIRANKKWFLGIFISLAFLTHRLRIICKNKNKNTVLALYLNGDGI